MLNAPNSLIVEKLYIFNLPHIFQFSKFAAVFIGLKCTKLAISSFTQEFISGVRAFFKWSMYLTFIYLTLLVEYGLKVESLLRMWKISSLFCPLYFESVCSPAIANHS